MSLFEFNLEKPAFKRVVETGTDAPDTVESESIDAETTDAAADEGGSRRRPGIGVVALLAVVVAALAIKRRRS